MNSLPMSKLDKYLYINLVPNSQGQTIQFWHESPWERYTCMNPNLLLACSQLGKLRYYKGKSSSPFLRKKYLICVSITDLQAFKSLVVQHNLNLLPKSTEKETGIDAKQIICTTTSLQLIFHSLFVINFFIKYLYPLSYGQHSPLMLQNSLSINRAFDKGLMSRWSRRSLDGTLKKYFFYIF